MERFVLTVGMDFLEIDVFQKQMLITITTNQKPTLDFLMSIGHQLKKKSKIKGLMTEYEIQIIQI